MTSSIPLSFSLTYYSLIPRPFVEPGTHHLRMCQNIRKIFSKTFGKLIQHVDPIIITIYWKICSNSRAAEKATSNPWSASAVLIVQYATYEPHNWTFKHYRVEVRISGVIYGSIQLTKILGVMRHAQTVYTNPFLLHKGPEDEAMTYYWTPTLTFSVQFPTTPLLPADCKDGERSPWTITNVFITKLVAHPQNLCW